MIYCVVQGRRMRSYKPKSSGARVEALDCAVYAYAAFVGRGGPQVLTTRRPAAVAAPESVLKTEPTPATITPPESVVPRRLPPRRAGRPGGWVNGWR